METCRTNIVGMSVPDYLIHNSHRQDRPDKALCLQKNSYRHTHTRLTALFPGLPGWAGTRKVKTNLDFTEARDSEWQ